MGGSHPPLSGTLLIVVGSCMLVACRYYLAQVVKSKHKLLELWVHYPKRKSWALTSLTGLTATL